MTSNQAAEPFTLAADSPPSAFVSPPEKLEAARRAAKEALRLAAERQTIHNELRALEYYADSWAKYSTSLEEQLNPEAALDPAVESLLGYPSSDDPTSMQVGSIPLVMRAGPELATEKLAEVPPGMQVEVLEVRQVDAQRRARIRYVAKEGWISRVYKEGWVTSVQADGTCLLVDLTFAPPSKPGLSAGERKARALCTSTAAMLQAALGSHHWMYHEERLGESASVPLTWLKQIESGVKLLQQSAQREATLKMELAAQRVRADAAESAFEARRSQLQAAEDEMCYAESREQSLKVTDSHVVCACMCVGARVLARARMLVLAREPEGAGSSTLLFAPCPADASQGAGGSALWARD